MTSAEIRQAFLDFFAAREHAPVASSSLVPGSDPTLLFTNAGMVQFKDVFLGIDQRPYKRATTSQKCMRISGKHNDLENVGPSPRHHTFFEMLGNFSFGDYFKKDAIQFAYDLLTEVYKLSPARLAFTVYQDDDEAYDIWVNVVGVDPSRVARMGSKTNFWQMAEIGPCGPTSEIHYDLQPQRGPKTIIEDLQAEDDRFLELWNLVFMQFNRTQPDPEHKGQFDQPLPAPGVDTGMGLERIAAVLQEVEANYDTDLFTDLFDATQEVLGHDNEFREAHTVAYRVIADHTRAASFLIADGVNPGTTGREYVVRMLIRRAWRFAHGMGVETPFLTGVADAVVQKMSPAYPELRQFQEAIRYQIATEEERFRRVLDTSLSVLGNIIEEFQTQGQTELDGDRAFQLYATHGLPLEITRDLLQEHGLSVDEAGFRKAQLAHSEASEADRDLFADVSQYQSLLQNLRASGKIEEQGVLYSPYDHDKLKFSSSVLSIMSGGEQTETASKGDTVEIVLPQTSFYVASGGQVSDTGTLHGDGWAIQVDDVHAPIGGLILHTGKVTSGRVKVGDSVIAEVDQKRRWNIMRNHTATHLLHASLRHVLGNHVRQKGSLVAPDRLRFDFTHNAPLSDDERVRINNEVSTMILANEPLQIMQKTLDEARHEGAMALFGEKYGSIVRTVTVCEPHTNCDERFSYELCGGTHVRSTAEIGSFLIISEESSGAGVRRIEAITGEEAQKTLAHQWDVIASAADQLRTEPDNILERIHSLNENLDAASRTITNMQKESAQDAASVLLGKARTIQGITLLAAQVDAENAELLSEMADWCRDKLQSAVVVLGSNINGTARLIATVTPDLQSKGLHAGKLVGDIARMVGGGGGGNPRFASAGGRNPDQLPRAIEQVDEIINSYLI